jgi:hypothetical protein
MESRNPGWREVFKKIGVFEAKIDRGKLGVTDDLKSVYVQ